MACSVLRGSRKTCQPVEGSAVIYQDQWLYIPWSSVCITYSYLYVSLHIVLDIIQCLEGTSCLQAVWVEWRPHPAVDSPYGGRGKQVVASGSVVVPAQWSWWVITHPWWGPLAWTLWPCLLSVLIWSLLDAYLIERNDSCITFAAQILQFSL